MIEPAISPDPQTEERPAAGDLRSRRLQLLGWVALVVLALIVVPPFVNLNHFRRSIVASISAGLGRPVHASAVELTLFPRPAFLLHNLTVAEDAAYGAEPVMMASTVTASLRASTLWHRRVEIASLHFNAPSLNLTRNAAGQWNFESLLHNSPALNSRGAPNAPSRVSSISQMPFPYVEATEARINFKLGPEKLPFSLEGADLALWKESDNEWHVRLRARPVRTDLTIADAGEIRVEGALQASSTLIDSPINARLEWRRVELGEIARLVRGKENGWRGTIDWTARAQGTLAKLLLSSNIEIDEFHRAEFVPPSEMDLTAQCHGQYVRDNRKMDSLQCDVPLGSGRLSMRGGFAAASSVQLHPPDPDSHRNTVGMRLDSHVPRSASQPAAASLQIGLHHAPAEFFLDLLRHIHPGVAEEAEAIGQFNGEANCGGQGAGTLGRCTGQIRSAAVTLTLPHVERALKFSPFLLVPAEKNPSQGAQNQRDIQDVTRVAENLLPSASMNWILMPAHVALGDVKPATIAGTLDSAGYALQISGPAELGEVAKLAAVLKVPGVSSELKSIHGNAQLALSLQSAWQPEPRTLSSTDTLAPQFAPSRWQGNLEIHDASLKLASLPGTLQLTSAEVNFTPTGVAWTGMKGTFARTAFDGSLRWQTPCPALESACARNFTLHTRDLSTSRIQAALLQARGSSNLLSVINPWAESSPRMPDISGTLNADKLSAGRISMRNVAMQIRLKGDDAQLVAISGNIFGGTFSGTGAPREASNASGALPKADTPSPAEIGSVQWGDGPPVYKLRVTLQAVQPDKVAAIWQEAWGRGAANAQIDLATQGWSASDMARNAAGKFVLSWRNGTLAARLGEFSPAASEITKFQRWDAEGTIRNRTLVLRRSEIFLEYSRQLRQQRSVSQSVAGTVTFGRILNLHLQPSDITVSGPLTTPIATAADKTLPTNQPPISIPVAGQSPTSP